MNSFWVPYMKKIYIYIYFLDVKQNKNKKSINNKTKVTQQQTIVNLKPLNPLNPYHM